MDPGSVLALVTRFSLKDRRQRGAALAGPYVHGAMCVLARARFEFSRIFLIFCRNLARNNTERDDISAALFGMFVKMSSFCQIESARSVKTEFARRQVAAGFE